MMVIIQQTFTVVDILDMIRVVHVLSHSPLNASCNLLTVPTTSRFAVPEVYKDVNIKAIHRQFNPIICSQW